MNTTTFTLNQNPSHSLEFTHNLDSHEYLQPKQGYKGIIGTLVFVGFFFLLCPVKILSDRNDHLPLDYDTVTLWFLSIAFFFIALYSFPVYRQASPSKAILWLPTQDKNSQPCLHIRSKNIHFFLGITFLFFFFLAFLCAAYALGAIPPSQVLQPWNWIRIMPFNMKADLMCAAADGSLLLLILLPFFYSQWHITYTPHTLHIHHQYPLQHRTATTLHTPWEQLATVNLIQCNTYNSDKPHIWGGGCFSEGCSCFMLLVLFLFFVGGIFRWV